MKLLTTAIIVLLAAVSVALIVQNDPGYVLIRRSNWTLETTFTFSVIALVLSFILLYYLIRVLVNVWGLPHRLRKWRSRRQARKARAALTRGLIQLEEGQWQAAEKTLAKSADKGDPPLLHYLGAARAAQKQGAHERRDGYLRLAHLSKPEADVAIGLTQAELQLSHHQPEQALATLRRLPHLSSKHDYVLKLLMKLYVELRDWGHLLELLPDLRSRKVISKEEADALEIRTYTGLIAKAAHSQDLQILHNVRRTIPKRLRYQQDILATYVHHLRALGAEIEAETLLREALRKHWSDGLAYLYGLVEGPDPKEQLAFAEALLRRHGKNPLLLLSLGRLCLRNNLWGKARGYLEASISMGPRAETYQELGRLLENMGEPQTALEAYRRGLLMKLDNASSSSPLRIDQRPTLIIEALPVAREASGIQLR